MFTVLLSTSPWSLRTTAPQCTPMQMTTREFSSR
jgi:hypothetical protein